jgi:hypothetical protein
MANSRSRASSNKIIAAEIRPIAPKYNTIAPQIVSSTVDAPPAFVTRRLPSVVILSQAANFHRPCYLSETPTSAKE